ncbi:MAG: DNA repair protein RecO [Defluviitaleaceae bacterium]|nr:DNA repair protein RecO [Defluviitaleaceae bacterium]
MKTIKARGIVLKEYETGESDKRLLLLCKGLGRVMVRARGARKPKSKFMASAQIFTYSDFILTEGRGFMSVAQADVIESFYELRTDYDRLCAAYAITEVCDKALRESENCDAILLLVLKSLAHLTKEKFPPAQISAVFMLRFFDVYGLRPRTDECVVCGAKEMPEFFFCEEGILCAAHGVLPISRSAVAAMSHILTGKLSEAFQFEANDSLLEELNKTAKLLWNFHFGVS